MPHSSHRSVSSRLAPLVLALLVIALPTVAQSKSGKANSGLGKALTFVDLMKMHTVKDPVISDNGERIAYELRPDRGDGLVEIRGATGKLAATIERGRDAVLTPDGAWAAAFVVPSLEDKETAEDDKPAKALHLVSVSGGSSARPVIYERVDGFGFSNDGKWLWVQHGEPEDKSSDEAAESEPSGEEKAPEPPSTEPASEEPATEEPATEEPGEEGEEENSEEAEEDLGTDWILRHLDTGKEFTLPHVRHGAIAETSDYFAYAVAAPGGDNHLSVVSLDSPDSWGDSPESSTVAQAEKGVYSHLTWAEDQPLLAFVASVAEDDEGTVWLWQGATGEGRSIVTTNAAPDGWTVPAVNELTWTRDGERLFFGFKPRSDDAKKKDADNDEDSEFDAYDTEEILSGVGLDVWHVNDPLIKTNEKEEWETEKDRIYLAVHHLKTGSTVHLGSVEVRSVQTSDGRLGVIAVAETPYLRDRTWDGFYADLYWISLEDGDKTLLAERVNNLNATISPSGRHVVWFQDGHWHLFDAQTQERRNITASMAVSFADEDHDYPSDVSGYGSPGWLEDGSAVLIYDKFDVWKVPVDGPAVNLTQGKGRAEQTQFRLWDQHADTPYLPVDSPWLVTGYRDRTKNDSVWLLGSDGDPLTLVHEAEKRFDLVARAKNADRVLFTRQSYREFPNLWTADRGFEGRKKLTDINPQIADFAWGQAELVEWNSDDGVPTQGVLIRPETLAEGESCPVLIYYYRFFSQRLHMFNDPKVNHRPSFPLYASNGYCVFLPDVRFEIGRPGLSAVKSLVPGVQKLVQMGIADPDALGLHGHSWSGYQTAFVITQTNIFAAAVAGAPVSNMTSAYGGIRWGSGLARQFQYEKAQSRLGASLWENRAAYIENSPLFYADRIETPLLIQFGDVDEAVPWTQGIELYLAMRRLGKDSIFLQYRDEPHHLKKYPNKLDYAMKMKEYFDHYLKGAPAAAWMTEGVPYRGE